MNMVNQIKDVMDVRMDELYNLAVQLSLDERIRSLFNVTYPFEGSDFININQAKKVMGQHSAINNFADYFTIYYPKSGYILSPLGNYDAHYFFNRILKFKDLNNDVLNSSLDQSHYKEIIPLTNIQSS